jgi:tellurite resistance protein TerC
MTYVFGAFLIYTAIKMLTSHDEEFNPENSKIYSLSRKLFPVTSHMDGQKFFITRMGKSFATPLFLALIVIEFTDVLFALDSIPAILAITADPFLVFSSNIFAILGLRTMYFFISNLLDKFQYVHYSLVAILAFVGIKMLLINLHKHLPNLVEHQIHFPEWVSLGFIFLALLVGGLVSYFKPSAPETLEEQHDTLNTEKKL